MKVIGKLISGINGLASGIAGVLVIIMVVRRSFTSQAQDALWMLGVGIHAIPTVPITCG